MLKIGIIGSGFGLYGLLPAFNATPGCQVASIYGRKTKYLVNYCKKIGPKRIYTDWQKMLDKENLDAVAIAVPPYLQYQIAKVAINKGLHIFAEKPLAANLKQAKELLYLAKKERVTTAVDFLFPEIEEWKKVKDLLDKKIFGKLKKIEVNWDFLSYDIKNKISSWKTDITLGGGVLSFYFCHCLYYLEYFVGKISNFKGRLKYSNESINGGEVGVDLMIDFENYVKGTAHLSCNSKSLNRHQLIFICDNGTIVLENKNSTTANFTVKINKDGRIKIMFKEKSYASKKNEDERVRVVKKLTTRFIDAITNNTNTTPSFKEGVRVQELIEKIKKTI